MNRSTRLLALLGPPLVLVVLWVLFVYQSRTDAVAEAEDRETVASNQASLTLHELGEAREFIERGREAEAELEALRDAVPDEIRDGDFVRLASEAADAAGVDVTVFNPSPPTDEVIPAPLGTVALRVSLSASGEQARIDDFLHRLTNLERAAILDEVVITSEGDGSMSASIVLRIFTTP